MNATLNFGLGFGFSPKYFGSISSSENQTLLKGLVVTNLD
jgi:hypothetical protein